MAAGKEAASRFFALWSVGGIKGGLSPAAGLSGPAGPPQKRAGLGRAQQASPKASRAACGSPRSRGRGQGFPFRRGPGGSETPHGVGTRCAGRQVVRTARGGEADGAIMPVRTLAATRTATSWSRWKKARHKAGRIHGRSAATRAKARLRAPRCCAARRASRWSEPEPLG
jgi:hypothetical protein